MLPTVSGDASVGCRHTIFTLKLTPRCPEHDDKLELAKFDQRSNFTCAIGGTFKGSSKLGLIAVNKYRATT
ncbi:hypothetical protein L3X38_042093 [Prunus dulcis]|uniref:Uncharacterized protein n=1 Tax=Prunus dulcis TaxID=3755 RepID=A0AAD4UVM0_PRUDU|nr:hypothetical protein L3X38_042093 [Prunus dulcis]